jgi:hypothetical protein
MMFNGLLSLYSIDDVRAVFSPIAGGEGEYISDSTIATRKSVAGRSWARGNGFRQVCPPCLGPEASTSTRRTDLDSVWVF